MMMPRTRLLPSFAHARSHLKEDQGLPRFSSSAGIAIGPILFIIALLGILATTMSAGVGNMSTSSTVDRVAADIPSQANLIRTKINECYMQFLSNAIDNSGAPPYDGVAACLHDMYPCSDQTNGTAVSDLRCPGDTLVGGNQQSLWTGPRPATLPPPTSGFGAWMYFNGGSTKDLGVKGGERCFWTIPTGGNSSAGVVTGLTRAAGKFTSSETNYSSASNTQKFVVFVTPPEAGVLSDNSPCAVP